MHETFQISIIGSGNVATNLAIELERVGHHIQQVWSLSIENAKQLAAQLTSARAVESLNLLGSTSDFFIIAVKDMNIASVLQELIIPDDKIILHTSGSFSLDSTMHNSHHTHIGIFYPLQTFVKSHTLDMSKVPLLLEFSNNFTAKRTKSLADSLSAEVHFIDSAERSKIHLAAVFTCNFVNHLFYVAEEILNSQGLEPRLLQPLIQNTIENIFKNGAKGSLTGPASRKDLDTINKHVSLLSTNSKTKELYEIFTQQIADRSNWEYNPC